MINVVVIDDEPLAREDICFLLEKHNDFNVVAQCGDVFSALRAIREHKPDVMFLDIIMPSHDGFMLLDYLGPEDHCPHTVIVTGGPNEFAVRAYTQEVFDYIEKPIKEERFDQMIARMRNLLINAEKPSAFCTERKLDFIPCLFNNSIKLIKPEDIEFARSDERGVYIICADAEFYTELTLSTLSVKASLNYCHRQYLINIQQIDELSLLENGLAEITTLSDKTIPVSRHYLKTLKQQLGLI